jgi:hypothetical protein
MGHPRVSPGRRLVVWAAVAIAVTGLAYGATWLVVANRFHDATLSWMERRQGEGDLITYSGLETGGFPTAVRVILSDATITGHRAGGSWSWAVDEAVVEASPLSPGRVTVRAPGAQRIEQIVGTRRVRYVGSATEVSVDVASGGRLPVGEVTIRDLVLESVDGGDKVAAASLDITARGDPTAPADERTATQELTLVATDIRLPRALGLPLGDDVTRLALTAKLYGTLEAGPWPDVLVRWRDAGGTIEVPRLELVYDPLSLSADGTLALDAANQPIGAFDARIVGASQTIDALRKSRLIGDGNAVAVKALLALTVCKPTDGGPPVLDIPLTLQERTLYAGPLTLAVVPEIRW